jgi:hypothetical protein
MKVNIQQRSAVIWYANKDERFFSSTENITDYILIYWQFGIKKGEEF